MATHDQTLAQAVEHHRLGQLDKAEQLYRALLEQDPYDVNALQLLGLVLYQTGQTEPAVDHLSRALRLNPSFAEVHNNLSNILTALGRYDAAIAGFREATRLKPGYAEAHNNLGALYQRIGKLDEAVACFWAALKLRPDYSEARKNLTMVLREQGKQEGHSDPEAALADAERANAEGIANHQQGRRIEAIASFLRAIELRPDYAEARNNLGVALQHQGKLGEALACFKEAVRINPDYADAHNNLGSAYQLQGELEEAAACYQRALRIRPDYAEARKNLGGVFHQQGRLEDAAACFRAALRLKPDFAEARKDLGVVLRDQGRLDEAVAAYREALRLRPDFPEAHAALGMVHLLAGRFEQGWTEYEWRLRCQQFVPPELGDSLPFWDGSPLEGKTILVCSEQGFGDVLQFVRFASVLKERGATVVFWCAPEMRELVATCPGVDHVITGLPTPVPCDCYTLLLSLPYRLGTTLATIPAQVPYLSAPPERRTYWQRELGGISGFKVGIAWQGNPGHLEDRQRSVRLEEFEPIAHVPGVRLLSLQKGPGTDQLPEFADRWGIVDLSTRMQSWADTAAAVGLLDLVISVDSAVVHLAGAIGAPAWVAQRYAPDWRWLLGRDDSPWYPTLRLYRQPRPGDWGSVFARIARELHERVR